MPSKRNYSLARVDYGKRILMDVIERPRPPDGHLILLVDMLAARNFCHEYRKNYRVALADIHLMIKASASMIESYPTINKMLDGYKIITPHSIDIGVSVAGKEGITPVVIIDRANEKSLAEIVEELKEKKRTAVVAEQQNLEKLRKISRLIPLNFVRRIIIRFLSQKHFIRRKIIGTFQITSLNVEDLDLHITNHLGTTLNLSTGAVVKRPIVIGNTIEIRPTLYTSWQPDSRVVSAYNDVLKAARKFKWLMEHPADLEHS